MSVPKHEACAIELRRDLLEDRRADDSPDLAQRPFHGRERILTRPRLESERPANCAVALCKIKWRDNFLLDKNNEYYRHWKIGSYKRFLRFIIEQYS